MNILTGYRAYIVAAGAVIAALAAFASGELTLAWAVNSALIGLGLATLRAAK